MSEVDAEAELKKEIQEELDRAEARELEQRQFDSNSQLKGFVGAQVVTKITTKTITKCFSSCPYFELDGFPGSVMICTHPRAGDLYIISHPACDTGFPPKCPLWAKDNA